MINHHPKHELLTVFSRGELPSSLSAAIAIHADMCPLCQDNIAAITHQQAQISFEQAHLHNFIVENDVEDKDEDLIDFELMIDNIVADDKLDMINISPDKTITVVGESFILPKAIKNMELGAFSHIGKLSRARFKLNEGVVHTSLLHIQPGGSVPEHTHKGYELTLLLAGSFHDEQGCYGAGDFIMLDDNVTHKPVSEHGCLCLTVANDSLHFTQGINKLLNPIGTFIY